MTIKAYLTEPFELRIPVFQIRAVERC